jgi:hypothetical protein
VNGTFKHLNGTQYQRELSGFLFLSLFLSFSFFLFFFSLLYRNIKNIFIVLCFYYAICYYIYYNRSLLH